MNMRKNCITNRSLLGASIIISWKIETKPSKQYEKNVNTSNAKKNRRTVKTLHIHKQRKKAYMFIYCMDDILNHSYIDEKNEEEGEKKVKQKHTKSETQL